MELSQQRMVWNGVYGSDKWVEWRLMMVRHVAVDDISGPERSCAQRDMGIMFSLEGSGG